MRRVAVLAIVFGCAGGSFAGAQEPSPPDSFKFLDREAYLVGEGPVQYRSGAVQLSQPKGEGPIDSLRVTIGGALRTPGGLPLNLDRGQFDPESYDVTLIREWPRALRFDTGDFDFDVSPHAGFGVSSLGGQAEGGARLEISPKSREQRAVEQLKDLGVKDGSLFGDKGRWYLFAAASGRAVGMNMLRNEGGWDQAGWTTDHTGALIGDAHVGVGWRKGDLQTSFGVIHREVRGQHMVFGQHTREDTVAAFSFSIRPQR